MKDSSARSDYFAYLVRRGKLKRMIRKLFLLPVARSFAGKVLDVGAGIGEFLESYKDSVGIDKDFAAVSYCTSKGLECVQADAHRLPFHDDSFDGVLLNNLLEHIEDPDTVMGEIRRVLKDGGKLVMELPGKKGFYFDETHVRFWTREEIVMFLERHGFRNIVTHYFPLPWGKAGDIFTHNKLRVSAVHAKKGRHAVENACLNGLK
jgi:ubiquinone/menaquinone biosynthesis C-methylase UbiE